MKDGAPNTQSIYTIGHSNHALEKFVELLEAFKIEVLVDVRSHPNSKYNPQYNSPQLRSALNRRGMKYLFFGRELGGRPDGEQYYGEKGSVLYDERAKSAEFLEGIQRLEKGVPDYCIALMCSEENPENCHRRLLITPVLRACDIEVLHIRGDASLLSESDILQEQLQPSLFVGDGIVWKSANPIAPKKTGDF